MPDKYDVYYLLLFLMVIKQFIFPGHHILWYSRGDHSVVHMVNFFGIFPSYDLDKVYPVT